MPYSTCCNAHTTMPEMGICPDCLDHCDWEDLEEGEEEERNVKTTILKEIAVFTYEMSFFTFISVPLAIVLFSTAHLFFETKRLIKWITN
jgi:hypothetical protein